MRALPILHEGAAPVAREVTGGAPPWPHQPLVEWQVVGQCNYDCSYCIQSKKYRRGAPTPAGLERSLAFLASLPVPLGNRWEVKTTGGEPFSWRPFLDVVVPRLIAMGHTVSTLTNLSASDADLVRFARLTHGRLNVVSASLHLEHTPVAAFLDRLALLRDAVAASTKIVVNAVLVPQALSQVAAAKHAVTAAGYTFFPQLMKLKGGVVAYTPEQMAQVREIVGDLEVASAQRTANLAPSYLGRRCWAGAQYFVLDQSGNAFSCRTAKRFGEGFLGNVETGVKLHGGGAPCPYPICPCTTPANRGMIEGVAARVGGNSVATWDDT